MRTFRLRRWLSASCLLCERCTHAQKCSRIFSTSSIPFKEKNVASSTIVKPRLDYRSISENALYKSHNAFNRKSSMPVGAVQSVARLYEEHKRVSSQLNTKLHERSIIGARIKTGTPDEKNAAVGEAQNLKSSINELEKRLSTLDDELLSLALTIPNDTYPETPIGSEDVAIVLSSSGPDPMPSSKFRDHVSVGKSLNLLDLDAGSMTTGSSWYYLLNEGALLELALVQYATNRAISHGFKPMMTPDVVRSDIASRCGFQPRDNADPPVHQMYHIQNTGQNHLEMVLSGTAEIPMAGYFINKIFPEDQLPCKLVGIGRAFRSEAGAGGTDTRGLYRVHQFTKVELFTVCTQDRSDSMIEEMLNLQIDIFKGLGLPIRVLEMPSEELGASAYRKIDIEAWMPGRGGWGEISSTSNCTDYQSRRLHIRYRSLSSVSNQVSTSLPFAHTLNGTAAAIPRLLVALLENGVRLDDESGQVIGLNLPICLKPFWLGKDGDCKLNIQWI